MYDFLYVSHTLIEWLKRNLTDAGLQMEVYRFSGSGLVREVREDCSLPFFT